MSDEDCPTSRSLISSFHPPHIRLKTKSLALYRHPPIDDTPIIFTSVNGDSPFDHIASDEQYYEGVIAHTSAAEGDTWVLTHVSYASLTPAPEVHVPYEYRMSAGVTYAKSVNGNPPRRIKTYYQDEEFTGNDTTFYRKSEWGRSYLQTESTPPGCAFSEYVKSCSKSPYPPGFVTQNDYQVTRENLLDASGSTITVHASTRSGAHGSQILPLVVQPFENVITDTELIDFGTEFWSGKLEGMAAGE